MRFETVNLSNKNQGTQLTRQVNSLRKRGIGTLNIIPAEFIIDVESNIASLSKVILHVERLQDDSHAGESSCADLNRLISSANSR